MSLFTLLKEANENPHLVNKITDGAKNFGDWVGDYLRRDQSEKQSIDTQNPPTATLNVDQRIDTPTNIEPDTMAYNDFLNQEANKPVNTPVDQSIDTPTNIEPGAIPYNDFLNQEANKPTQPKSMFQNALDKIGSVFEDKQTGPMVTRALDTFGTSLLRNAGKVSPYEQGGLSRVANAFGNTQVTPDQSKLLSLARMQKLESDIVKNKTEIKKNLNDTQSVYKDLPETINGIPIKRDVRWNNKNYRDEVLKAQLSEEKAMNANISNAARALINVDKANDSDFGPYGWAKKKLAALVPGIDISKVHQMDLDSMMRTLGFVSLTKGAVSDKEWKGFLETSVPSGITNKKSAQAFLNAYLTLAQRNQYITKRANDIIARGGEISDAMYKYWGQEAIDKYGDLVNGSSTSATISPKTVNKVVNNNTTTKDQSVGINNNPTKDTDADDVWGAD